jgi:hypothetical protein
MKRATLLQQVKTNDGSTIALVERDGGYVIHKGFVASPGLLPNASQRRNTSPRSAARTAWSRYCVGLPWCSLAVSISV